MKMESSVAEDTQTKSPDSEHLFADPIPPSAVERLIASRIAATRRDAAAELASARVPLERREEHRQRASNRCPASNVDVRHLGAQSRARVLR